MRRLWLVFAIWIGVGSIGTGCRVQSSECRSTDDCPAGETCISADGVFVGGGSCVADDLFVDADRRTTDGDATRALSDADASETGVEPADASDVADPRDGGAGRDARRDADGESTDDEVFEPDADPSPDARCPSGVPRTDSEPNCDGEDDDCDGAVDEGCSCDYRGRSTGVCADLERNAAGECPEPAAYSPPGRGEPCDGKDNDCDGTVDEGAACTPGEVRSCYSGPSATMGVGVCKAGTTTCRRSCSFGPCAGEVTPSMEDCTNGKDDDCDGRVDERSRHGGESCQNDCNCHSDDCRNGTCAHRMFVRATKTKADLGGLSGADSKCQSAAQNAGLTGNWKAVLSTDARAARQRLTINGAVVRMDGKTIANGSADLWDGSIDRKLKLDADGNTTMRSNWTGTKSGGGASGKDCNDWTSSKQSDNATYGYGEHTDARWIHMQNSIVPQAPCNLQLGLYCIDGQ